MFKMLTETREKRVLTEAFRRAIRWRFRGDSDQFRAIRVFAPCYRVCFGHFDGDSNATTYPFYNIKKR